MDGVRLAVLRAPCSPRLGPRPLRGGVDLHPVGAPVPEPVQGAALTFPPLFLGMPAGHWRRVWVLSCRLVLLRGDEALSREAGMRTGAPWQPRVALWSMFSLPGMPSS